MSTYRRRCMGAGPHYGDGQTRSCQIFAVRRCPGRPRPARRWLGGRVDRARRADPRRQPLIGSSPARHAERRLLACGAGCTHDLDLVAQAPDRPVLTSPGWGRSGADQVAQPLGGPRPVPVAQQRGAHPARRRRAQGPRQLTTGCSHRRSTANSRAWPRSARSRPREREVARSCAPTCPGRGWS
jgi:hypothetical protein